MKQEILKALESHWSSGRDREIVEDFVRMLLESCQPERLSEKSPKEYCAVLPDHPTSIKSTKYPEG